jgi:2-dehydro-3-deoxyglucarate aldolase
MTTTFKSSLYGYQPLIGTILTLPTPELAEICSHAGFDWLFLDMEHGLLDIPAVQRLAQVAGDCPCVVRVPAGDSTNIQRALDAGVAGVIVPQVNSAEQAAWAVRQAKYPPVGDRGTGVTRAHDYGARFTEYVTHANAEVTIIIQAEHIRAVEQIDSILTVDGVDAVIIGPYDLSASMGKSGQVSDPDVQAAIARVRKACTACRRPVGIFTPNVAAAQQALQSGYTLLPVGIDGMLLTSMYHEIVVSLRATVTE